MKTSSGRTLLFVFGSAIVILLVVAGFSYRGIAVSRESDQGRGIPMRFWRTSKSWSSQ